MKTRTALAAALLLFVHSAFSQDARPEPTQNPDAPFRLFSTRNIYTFLKLGSCPSAWCKSTAQKS
jgi:hypothetical protein